MRIVAGEFRGRSLTAPRGTATRPTTDRVKESLFSILASLAGPELGGGPVLDAFAGSGALGLEALSRGATPVVFVEKDRAALEALRANVEKLRSEQRVRIVPRDVFALAARPAEQPYSLILLDPPYTLDPARVGSLLQALAENGSVQDGCLVTWEHASGAEPGWPKGFGGLTSRRYGSTTIDIARYARGEAQT